jgi:hypothetical protein
MVENKQDNDGVFHPGWLNYYKEEFPKNGFNILSEYNFNYAIVITVRLDTGLTIKQVIIHL